MANNKGHKEQGATCIGEIAWRDGQPVSTVFDDVYFSKSDGLAESRHVYLNGNNLPERWARKNDKNTFTIFETGFGTGLNFLMTWQAWNTSSKKIATLNYLAVDLYPLTLNQLAQAHLRWPELAELSSILLKHYPPQPWQGFHRILLSADCGKTPDIVLTLIFADALKGLDKLGQHAENLRGNTHLAFGEYTPNIDAWYLDGFAPAKNPDMWTDRLFALIAKNSATNTTAATFTVAGNVRRGLVKFGFKCKKQSGFGKKREMLCAKFLQHSESEKNKPKTPTGKSKVPSWILKSTSPTPKRIESTILVVGAGLAGCHTAHALAERNHKVLLIDRSGIAAGASGNLQGAVYTRLSASNDVLTELNLAAQMFADQFYENQQLYKKCGQQCGVFHLANSERAHKNYQAFVQTFAEDSVAQNYAQWLDASDTLTVTGLKLNYGGLFLRRSGWLNPKRVCEQLLHHPNISTQFNCNVTKIDFDNDQWRVFKNDDLLASGHICIICNAHEAREFEQTSELPLKKIRGQVTHITHSEELAGIKSVICGEGYIAPPISANNVLQHCIGATFDLNNPSPELSLKSHQENINALAGVSSQFDTKKTVPINENPGKVGFRCATPDYFPIVGPVPQQMQIKEDFTFLSKKANAIIDSPGTYYPQLYCNLGYGSRGLAYAPLCAQILADLITGEHLPISNSLFSYLHPARFTIRDLIRNKI